MSIDRFQIWTPVWEKQYPSGVTHKIDIDRTAGTVMISSHSEHRADGLIFTREEWREAVSCTQGIWAMPNPPLNARPPDYGEEIFGDGHEPAQRVLP